MKTGYNETPRYSFKTSFLYIFFYKKEFAMNFFKKRNALARNESTVKASMSGHRPFNRDVRSKEIYLVQRKKYM
jgi:hypothetical protein